MWRTYIAPAKRLSQLCVSVTVLAWFGSALAQAQRYTITDLGSLGGTTTIAYGENSHGDAVGFSYSTGAGCYFQAFRYTHASGMTDIGLQPNFGGCNYAVSINDVGQIAFNGDHHPGSGDYTAHLFSPRSGAVDLGTLPGDTVSYAVHLNAFGEVLGGSASSALLGDPFLYIPKKGMIDLGNLGGGRGTAEHINNLGFVVGSARVANTPVGDIWNIGHAFVYTGATGIIDLNKLTATPGWELYECKSRSGGSGLPGCERGGQLPGSPVASGSYRRSEPERSDSGGDGLDTAPGHSHQRRGTDRGMGLPEWPDARVPVGSRG